MTYQETLRYLLEQLPMYQRIGGAAFNKDLRRTEELLKALGNPERRLKCVHVAGTNGKGSTAHLLASIYQAEGYRVGLHTSPHLTSFTERIRINGQEVEEPYVVSFVDQVRSLIKSLKPSFFELTVAMALKYFADKAVDLAIIEVGLGGRLDSTNVIEPMVSVITSIGLDHQKFLGDTIAEIAREKAGIIKSNVPVVVGDIPKEALNIVEEVALENKASLSQGHSKYGLRESSPAYILKKGEVTLGEVVSDLKGDALTKNLPTVMNVVEVLQSQFPVSMGHMRHGIANVCQSTGLMGRWQVLHTCPMVVCDVGHNAEAVRQIVNRVRHQNKKVVHVVWGMVEDKAKAEVLSLLPLDWKYYFCAPNIERALSSSELQRRANEMGIQGNSYPTVQSAYASAKKSANNDDFVFIGGSTFVVAEVLE